MKEETPETRLPSSVAKKVYEAPAIEELGNVAELTQGGGGPAVADLGATST